METEMTAWHTGNAGIVIQVYNIEGKSSAAIGFDVFAKQPGGIYPDTPEAIRQELLRDIREKKLGTLVFTHEHADHFCPEDVAEALKMNPDLRIISTEETIRRIRALEPEEIADPAATDGAYLSTYGVPTVDALSAIAEQIHTTEERVRIPSIRDRTALCAAMLGLLG